jgi:hypothetical protein
MFVWQLCLQRASHGKDSGALRLQTDGGTQCNHIRHRVIIIISEEDGDCK